MSAIGVFTVDDDDDVRILVRTVFRVASPEMTVCGEAASGESAIALLAAIPADVVVLDQSMPGISGVTTARLLRDQHPDVRIILFTAHLTPELERDAIAAGVDSCLSKAQYHELVPEARRLATSQRGDHGLRRRCAPSPT